MPNSFNCTNDIFRHFILSLRATGIASEEHQGTYIAKTNTGEYDKGLVEEILIQISKTFTWIFRRRLNSGIPNNMPLSNKAVYFVERETQQSIFVLMWKLKSILTTFYCKPIETLSKIRYLRGS